jgi:hypothetical protein
LERRSFAKLCGLGTASLLGSGGPDEAFGADPHGEKKIIKDGYNPRKALMLAMAVCEAYKKYADPSYTIRLGAYVIKDSIYVFEATKRKYVFFGFTASGSMSGAPPFDNILALRGTRTDQEAFADASWALTDCVLPRRGKQHFGRAAAGLYSFYTGRDLGLVTSLADALKSAVSKLDGTLSDWYIAGHSLGGAVATLGALDAVVSRSYGRVDVPPKLYTFGSLHAGDAEFASAFSNSGLTDVFRVVNLADWVPGFTGIGADTPGYAHVGLECSYLWQTGFDWANHSLENNYLAVLRDHPEVIQFGPRQYPQ